jgi:DNA-binding MarR family transcriptional regulator
MPKSTPSARAIKIKLDYVTFKMDIVSERAKEVASKVYQREVGLGLRELRLMRFIGSYPGLTLSSLVVQTHVEKTLVSKAVTALVARELVVRSIGEADARKISLHLTKKGEKLVKEADFIGQRMEKKLMQDIPEEDVVVFRRCLELLYEASDEMMEMAGSHLKQVK